MSHLVALRVHAVETEEVEAGNVRLAAIVIPMVVHMQAYQAFPQVS